ncbi:ethylmalonyl-CoA decarboxylase isoform X1 [Girardinichthys multiradiatus]|nr:ethylmalonyl-CoA decarboxylase isoform X1 [Girardinichthys multiradiatus]
MGRRRGTPWTGRQSIAGQHRPIYSTLEKIQQDGPLCPEETAPEEQRLCFHGQAAETEPWLCLLQHPWLQPRGDQREAAGLSWRLRRSAEARLWYRCADHQQPDSHERFLCMMVDLKERVSQLENWSEGKGLIVHGAAETFCSGSDLNAVRAISNPQDGMKMCMFMQDALTRLLRLPLISVALVEGRALGGGAELTTACDFRLMTSGSVIQFVHKHMGLVPGWGGAARLVRIVGSQKALKLLGGALKVDPELGLDIGLADEVLEADQGAATALQQAENWLSRYTKGPVPVIHAVKKVVLAGRELPLSEALRTEKEVFGTVWGAPANLQALASKSKHK